MQWVTMLAVMKRWLVGMAVAGGCLFVATTVAVAQPLVTGDLALYYDFEDEWTDVVPDESGNGLDATVHNRVFKTTESIRGTGAAVFDPLGMFEPGITDPPPDPTVYPDHYLKTENVTPEGWGAAVTFAAWVNLTRYADLCDPGCFSSDTSHEIISVAGSVNWTNFFEARTSFADGQLRGKLNAGGQGTVTSARVWFEQPDGPWPNGEWFHFAQTYDSQAMFDGQDGHVALYVNGELALETYADGAAGAVPLDIWWGAYFGMVSDHNRQLNGFMDEVYIYTRALLPEEVMSLYEIEGAWLVGDVNLDGAVNGLDVGPFVALVVEGVYQIEADCNFDMDVNGLDVRCFVDLVIGGGEAGTVPEPTTLTLATLALGLLCWRRKRR